MSLHNVISAIWIVNCNILLIGSKWYTLVDKALFDRDKCSRGGAFRLLYSFGVCFHLRTLVQCFVPGKVG